MGWGSGLVVWMEGRIAYISVVFSWLVQKAYQQAVWHKYQGYSVRVGGPAAAMNAEVFKGIAEVGGDIDALPHHNPEATMTTRRCVRNCPFCIVPRIEGALRELDVWTPRRLVCDNNLLAASWSHFCKVVDTLREREVQNIDFNQGLDARLLTSFHADKISSLNLQVVRLAWDFTPMEGDFRRAVSMLRSASIPKEKLSAYILIGYKDSPEDARYRLEVAAGIVGHVNPMRYNPLDAVRRDRYVGENWTDRNLRRFMRYWSHKSVFGGIPFDEFRG